MANDRLRRYSQSITGAVKKILKHSGEEEQQQQQQQQQASMVFERSFDVDVLLLIFESLPTDQDRARMAGACRDFYALLNHHVYRLHVKGKDHGAHAAFFAVSPKGRAPLRTITLLEDAGFDAAKVDRKYRQHLSLVRLVVMRHDCRIGSELEEAAAKLARLGSKAWISRVEAEDRARLGLMGVSKYCTVLDVAMARGLVKVVEALSERTSRLGSDRDKLMFARLHRSHRNHIHQLGCYNPVHVYSIEPILVALLQQGVDIDKESTCCQCTPLSEAINCGNVWAARAFIKHGAEVKSNMWDLAVGMRKVAQERGIFGAEPNWEEEFKKLLDELFAKDPAYAEFNTVEDVKKD